MSVPLGDVDELTADAFLGSTGVIPRMSLLACGHEAAADPFKSATDKSWWSQPFKFALWNPLGSYAKKWDARNSPRSFAWTDDLVADVADAKKILEEIRADGWGHCAPWVLPRAGAPLDKPGMWPVKQPLCTKVPVDGEKLIPQLKPEIPWWLWLLLAYAVGRKTR